MKVLSIFLVCLLAVSFSACAAKQPSAPKPDQPAASSLADVQQASVSSASTAKAASKPEKPAPAPLPEVQFSSPQVELGEVLVLTVTNAAKAKAETTLPYQPVFYPDGDKLIGFFPVATNAKPGSYKLTITADDSVFEYTITVADREFVVQNLTMDENTEASTNTAEANLEWERIIEPLKLISDPVRHWSGPFTQPVQGEITTEYGTIRYTNGSTVASRHNGIDFAAARGTQTVASNAGRIQYAGFLQLTGNTVVIEHGFGLKSFYYHMDSLDVATDDMVKSGDPIGKVGSTGYSTGPHLHFAMLVNHVFTNPWTAFEKGIA